MQYGLREIATGTIIEKWSVVPGWIFIPSIAEGFHDVFVGWSNGTHEVIILPWNDPARRYLP